MFQYATLKALSLELGYEAYLPDHTNIKHDGCYDFTNGRYIPYRLELQDHFNISLEVIKHPNVGKTYRENTFTYNPNIFDVEDSTEIDGYFQSYKYFHKYREEILKDFTFKSYVPNKPIPKVNMVSIHVRRGDYVAHPGFHTLDVDYYIKALEEHFSDRDYTFLVFSDDIEWCKQVFKEGFIFMENTAPIEDLFMMSGCVHHILSNSTFSWWGAYLSNDGGKVIAPNKWYTDNRSLNDLYLPNWIKI
jgi:hypothetical protein